MMNLDVQSIALLPSNINSTDYFHVLKLDDSIILSEKSSIGSLSSVFESASNLELLKQKLSSIKTSIDKLFSKFATKSFVDSNFISKEVMENITHSLLLKTEMETVVSKYATESNLIEKGASARQEAIRLADEMTDFAGAAMVGINQSGGGNGEEEQQPE